MSYKSRNRKKPARRHQEWEWQQEISKNNKMLTNPIRLRGRKRKRPLRRKRNRKILLRLRLGPIKKLKNQQLKTKSDK
jgi:hypothetical protein